MEFTEWSGTLYVYVVLTKCSTRGESEGGDVSDFDWWEAGG